MSEKPEKKDRRLRIIWNSNGHWTNSGYGIFTRDILTRLAKDGWPVAEIAFWGLQSACIDLDGIRVYPNMGHLYGADAMVSHSQHFKADVTFSFQDVPTLDPNMLRKIKNWIAYVPIDQEPIPPLVLQNLKLAYKIITFSEFGRKALEKNGFYSQMIYEGTDTEIFKPMEKPVCRQALKLPQDKFFFGMVAANKENPPRKGFQEVLEAFQMFAKDHPEAAILFHTQQVAPGGFPIQQYAVNLGIANKVFFVNQYDATYHSRSNEIAKELNALDVYLQPSQTEGFGLTSIEAQSCGIPVIVNNCHSQPELVVGGKTGEICKTEGKHFSNQGGFWYRADVNSLHEKMEICYKKIKSGQREQIAKDCREHIVKNFNIDTQFKTQWLPLFENLQNDLLTKPTEKVK